MSSESRPNSTPTRTKSGPALCANDFEYLIKKTILIVTTEAYHSTKQDIKIFHDNVTYSQ